MSTGVTTDSDLLQGVNASLSFNQDGSKSLNTGANLKIPIQTPWVYLEINMGLGFAMNSYSGATLSTHGGACVGEAGTCVGMEDGGSLYFDRSGGFSGMTVYTELYLQIAGEGRISTGYEAGLLGAEGRGLYAGASAFGVHAEVSQNGGTSWGWSKHVAELNYDSDKATWLSMSLMGFDIPLVESLKIVNGVEGLLGKRINKKIEEKNIEDSEGLDFVVAGHGVYERKEDGSEVPNGQINIGGKRYNALQLKDWLYANGYQDGQNIRLFSCGNAVLAKELSKIIPNVMITGASTKIHVPHWFGNIWLEDSGYWNSYQNGKLVGAYRDGFWD